MPPKNLYLIAGCNGAGKTTASYITQERVYAKLPISNNHTNQ